MSSLKLLGAPDDNIGNPPKEQHIGRALQVTLPQRVVDDIVKCTHAGKPVQFSFGSDPLLRFGDDSRPIKVTPSNFRLELYRDQVSGKDELQFDSLISHQAVLSHAKAATKGAEKALATLQASLAQHQKDKQDNSATFIRAEPNKSKNERGSKALGLGIKNNDSKALRRSAFVQNVSRSMPPSPSLLATSKLSSNSAQPPSSQPSTLQPTSASHNQAKTQAQKFVLLHFLALGPASEEAIQKKTAIPRGDLVSLLDKYANLSDSGNPQWELRERFYKDLQVWSFKYPTPEDRQAAVDNCIRAFDRQRIPREDKLWQMLLSKEQRGKGIVLSKLNLASNSTSAHKPTSSLNDQSFVDPKQSSGTAGGEVATLKKATDKEAIKPVPKPPAQSPQSNSPAAASSHVDHKRKALPGTDRSKDGGADDERSIDLEKEHGSVQPSDGESKPKATKPAREPKKVNIGSKPKSSGKVKSAERIDDSDELLEEAEAEAEAEAGDHKRVKTNDGTPKPATPVKNNATLTAKKKPELTPKAAPIRSMDKISTRTVTKAASKPNRNDKQALETNVQSKANTSSQSTGNKQATVQTNAPTKERGNSTSGPSSNNQTKKDPVRSHRHTQSLPTNPVTAQSIKQTNGIKRAADNQKDSEIPAKKPRPSTHVTSTGRHGSSSSPTTNHSDLPSMSPSVGNKRSPPGEAAQKSTKISSSSGTLSEDVNGVTKISSGSSQSTSGPSQAFQNVMSVEASLDVLLKDLRKKYNQRFRDHITMHLNLDKRPAGVARDDNQYRNNHDEMMTLVNDIKSLMRRAGQDESTFPQIPKNFSTASVPGLMDFVREKLSSLNKALRAERESVTNGHDITPAQRKRIEEIRSEITDLRALRDH